MRPFFSFYGGKWRAAKLYPPPAGLVVEPFAGSAGYSVYHGVPRAVLVERDPKIAGVWRYLIRATPEELLRLPDFQPGQTVNDLDVPQEARWLIGFWINPGSEQPRLTPSKWMRQRLAGEISCWSPNSVWGPGVRERLATQVPMIRRWRIVEGDYSEAPDVVATWFIDPPYDCDAGRKYKYHDVDRRELARFCRSRLGARIVCESAGAKWLPFKPLAVIKGTIGRYRRGTSAEAVWLRGGGGVIGSLFSGIGGLEGRKTYAPALVDGVRRLYATGLTQGEVARALGITQKVVWRLMRRHGLRARVAAKRDQRGERNHMWKGAGAGYQAMHQRVAVVRGTPSHCEKCGTTRSKRFEWASLSRRYDDPFDYVRLCCSCHHVLDGHVRNLGAHAEGKAVSP